MSVVVGVRVVVATALLLFCISLAFEETPSERESCTVN